MKIFFTVSRSGRHKYSSWNKLILNEIRKHKVQVITTVGRAYLADKPKLHSVKDLSVSEDKHKYVHDTTVKRAIFVSDAVVVEASYQSFRLGFETHFALSQQKPVLVLSQERNYASLIKHPNFFGAKYTKFTLPDEIEKFVTHAKKYKLRNRFNMFISDGEKGHLQTAAGTNNVSMSNYIRKLIQQDIAKSTGV